MGNAPDPKILDTILHHFAERADPYSPPVIAGVGLAVPPPPPNAAGTAVSDDDKTIVVFVNDLAKCELDYIWTETRGVAQTDNLVLLKTGHFNAASAAASSISPYVPDLCNVPPVLAGSFGLVAALGSDPPKTPFIVTANHAVKFNGRVPDGSPIVNPGTLDDKNHVPIGTSSPTFGPLTPAPWPNWTTGTPNTLDWAVVEVTDPAKVAAFTLPVTAPPIPQWSLIQVQHSGRSTQPGSPTKGFLIFSDVKTLMFMSFGTFYFTELGGIVGLPYNPGLPGKNLRQTFAKPGDSGSFVQAVTGEGVGLVVGRAYCSGGHTPLKTPPPGAAALKNLVGYIVLSCRLDLLEKAIGKNVKFKARP